jgi:uncharacterized cupin superfamily protein
MFNEITRSSEYIVGAGEGTSLMEGFAILKLVGGNTGDAFSVLEHNLPPHSLAAPMHTHRDTDEFSYVLEGEIGAQIGDHVVQAGVGALVVKPKGIAHTFWNASPRPARILEIVSPAGFERYFEELEQLLASSNGQPEPAAIVRLADKYGMEMDFSSVPVLMATYGVKLGK